LVFTVLSLGGAVGGLDVVNRQDIIQFLRDTATLAAKPSYFDFSYDRLIFLAVFFLVVVVLIESVLNRNRPVTVLASELRVEFLDATGADVKLTRTQYLRANHPNVTAYYTLMSALFGGTIPRHLVVVSAFAGNKHIPNHANIPPTSGEARLEIAHVFDQGMPFGLANILIPEFILRWIVLHTSFKPAFVVRRGITTHFKDEHVLNDTYYEATADRYTQRHVKVIIKFDGRRPPNLTDGVLEGQLLKRRGVEVIYFTATGAETHECFFRRLQNETVRIRFKF
jgi:hypothetical protein